MKLGKTQARAMKMLSEGESCGRLVTAASPRDPHCTFQMTMSAAKALERLGLAEVKCYQEYFEITRCGNERCFKTADVRLTDSGRNYLEVTP